MPQSWPAESMSVIVHNLGLHDKIHVWHFLKKKNPHLLEGFSYSRLGRGFAFYTEEEKTPSMSLSLYLEAKSPYHSDQTHKKGMRPGWCDTGNPNAPGMFLSLSFSLYLSLSLYLSPFHSDQTHKKGVCPGQSDTGNPSTPGMPKQF